MILLFFLFPDFIRSLETLQRKSRSVEVGSVLIENETDELIKVHVESNLAVSGFHATEVNWQKCNIVPWNRINPGRIHNH